MNDTGLATWLPERIDDYVRQEIAAGRAERVWPQIRDATRRRAGTMADPLWDAALLLAQARFAAGSHSLAAGAAWLEQARRTAAAAGVDLAVRFHVGDLEEQLAAPPQVVDGRFVPDVASIEVFASRSWVRCGRCGAPGMVRSTWPATRLRREPASSLVRPSRLSGLQERSDENSTQRDTQFACVACAYRVQGDGIRFGSVTLTGETRCQACGRRVHIRHSATLKGSVIAEVKEPCGACGGMVQIPVHSQIGRDGAVRDARLGMALLLVTELSQGVLFAHNGYHLAQLRCYVEASFRDERYNSAHSWSARLPTWIKAAKNRDKVLRALNKLDNIADNARIGRSAL